MLKAKPGDGRAVRSGEAVKLMVRPEMLSVLQQGAKADNVIEARLMDVILVGGVTKTYARLADGKVVTATGLTHGPLDAAEKDAGIRLGWAKESCVVLPRDGPAT